MTSLLPTSNLQITVKAQLLTIHGLDYHVSPVFFKEKHTCDGATVLYTLIYMWSSSVLLGMEEKVNQ